MDDVDLFIQNLRALMKSERFSSQSKIAKAANMSQSHVGNILRKDKIPSVEIIQQIANGVGLKTWQMFLPAKQFQKGPDAGFNDLLTFYLESNQKGRDTILGVAEAQASHNPASQDK